ncbi:MAG: nuclear transport factor 2 family protein [Candidatus Dormibacteraeota bacterium]|nr:nuclear transport factor 2 family protein [Candidatus Dormibacteraeota bacterium]MBO0761348.1 nuclear transport factor 2 family protein [Candidatus Dormibacteraeota bacterium]
MANPDANATATPREVFDRLLRGITQGSPDTLGDLYAEDAVVELPFARPAPQRIEGREQLAARFQGAGAIPLEFEARNVVVHQTTDPEVIVAEFDYVGRATTTGRPLHVTNIQVLRVRDGKIVASRDFHDHLAIADALGTPVDRLP